MVLNYRHDCSFILLIYFSIHFVQEHELQTESVFCNIAMLSEMLAFKPGETPPVSQVSI